MGEEIPGLGQDECMAEVEELGGAVALDPGAVGGVVVGVGLELSEDVVEDGSCLGLGWRELVAAVTGDMRLFVLAWSCCHV